MAVEAEGEIGEQHFMSLAHAQTREQLEGSFVEKESKNPNVLAIYSEWHTSPKGARFLAYTVVLRDPPVGTAEGMMEAARARLARPLFRRYET